MKLPNEIGPIHFVGIGGIGMSGIAEVLLNPGHKVVLDASATNASGPFCSRLRSRSAVSCQLSPARAADRLRFTSRTD